MHRSFFTHRGRCSVHVGAVAAVWAALSHLRPASGSFEWCWDAAGNNISFPSEETCCHLPEATLPDWQRQCWPSAPLGLTFLSCCYYRNHGQTLYQRGRRSAHAINFGKTSGEVVLLERLMIDLSWGFGPLDSAYEAKDAHIILQLCGLLPPLEMLLTSTRTLALHLATSSFQRNIRHSATLLPDEGVGSTAAVTDAEVVHSAVLDGWVNGSAISSSAILEAAEALLLDTGVVWIDFTPPEGQWIGLPSVALRAVEDSERLSLGRGFDLEGQLSMELLLESHLKRVAWILRQGGPLEAGQAAQEVARSLALLGQRLVLLLLAATLQQRPSFRPLPDFSFYEPPIFTDACCERYRVLLHLLTELWHESGQGLIEYVEVGVAEGNTVLFLLERLHWLRATLVDSYPDPKGAERILGRLRPYRGRVELLVLSSIDAARHFRLHGLIPDVVFLDGDHSYGGSRCDLLAWDPLVRPGGLSLATTFLGNTMASWLR